MATLPLHSLLCFLTPTVYSPTKLHLFTPTSLSSLHLLPSFCAHPSTPPLPLSRNYASKVCLKSANFSHQPLINRTSDEPSPKSMYYHFLCFKAHHSLPISSVLVASTIREEPLPPSKLPKKKKASSPPPSPKKKAPTRRTRQTPKSPEFVDDSDDSG